MLHPLLRLCLALSVFCSPALTWADTLLLTVEVQQGQHRLVVAQTIDRTLSTPPRSSPDHAQLWVEARGKGGAMVYAVKMDDYWDAPPDVHEHMPAPDSYVLRIPKSELVQSVRITRPATNASAAQSTVLLEIQKSPAGWK